MLEQVVRKNHIVRLVQRKICRFDIAETNIKTMFFASRDFFRIDREARAARTEMDQVFAVAAANIEYGLFIQIEQANLIEEGLGFGSVGEAPVDFGIHS